MKKIVKSERAPQPIGPYSQAIKSGGFLFISGQTPLDAHTGQIVYGGVQTQTHQVIANLKSILEKENLALENVVKTTVFLKDINNFPLMNEAYAKYFTNEPPARTTVEVSRLPMDVEVEIDAIAVYP
ncbi:2-iminobutanoate/2-iminopropanoate deaminase rida [Holotrichia oblita]|nr:2-iminobutanoate/2-iminopropanoate deaminase rida [Holotrichia oblita]